MLDTLLEIHLSQYKQDKLNQRISPSGCFRIEGGRGNKNKSTPREIFMTNREETNNQRRFLPLHPLGKKKKEKKNNAIDDLFKQIKCRKILPEVQKNHYSS